MRPVMAPLDCDTPTNTATFRVQAFEHMERGLVPSMAKGDKKENADLFT